MESLGTPNKALKASLFSMKLLASVFAFFIQTLIVSTPSRTVKTIPH